MDDFEHIMAEIDKLEAKRVKELQGFSKILLAICKAKQQTLDAAVSQCRRLRVVSILAAILAAVCLCVCFYHGTIIQRYNGEMASLRGEISSIHRILEEGVVIEETTTTTTTTVEQDTGEGSGNNVYQAG